MSKTYVRTLIAIFACESAKKKVIIALSVAAAVLLLLVSAPVAAMLPDNKKNDWHEMFYSRFNVPPDHAMYNSIRSLIETSNIDAFKHSERQLDDLEYIFIRNLHADIIDQQKRLDVAYHLAQQGQDVWRSFKVVIEQAKAIGTQRFTQQEKEDQLRIGHKKFDDTFSYCLRRNSLLCQMQRYAREELEKFKKIEQSHSEQSPTLQALFFINRINLDSAALDLFNNTIERLEQKVNSSHSCEISLQDAIQEEQSVAMQMESVIAKQIYTFSITYSLPDYNNLSVNAGFCCELLCKGEKISTGSATYECKVQ